MVSKPDKQRRRGDGPLLVALAAGDTIAEAAKVSGLSERTVSRRLGDDDFRFALQAEKDAIVSLAATKLSSICLEAVEALNALLEASSDSIRLGAARAILEYASKMREAIELTERIARLEAKLNGGRNGKLRR